MIFVLTTRNCVSKTRNFASKMMIFVLKTRNFALKMMIFVLKTRNFALKMMNFAGCERDAEKIKQKQKKTISTFRNFEISIYKYFDVYFDIH